MLLGATINLLRWGSGAWKIEKKAPSSSLLSAVSALVGWARRQREVISNPFSRPDKSLKVQSSRALFMHYSCENRPFLHTIGAQTRRRERWANQTPLFPHPLIHSRGAAHHNSHGAISGYWSHCTWALLMIGKHDTKGTKTQTRTHLRANTTSLQYSVLEATRLMCYSCLACGVDKVAAEAYLYYGSTCASSVHRRRQNAVITPK